MFHWLRARRWRLGRLTGDALGSRYTVKLATDRMLGEDELVSLQGLVEACVDRVNRLMSPWRTDSEVARFNRHSEDSPFALSAEVFRVLQHAVRIGEESGGAFDVTIGPMVNLYGFGRDALRLTWPGEEELESMRGRVGYRLLELDEAARSVRKRRPDVQCDLSGIAKGFAVDEVAAGLEARGIGHYVVEIGGEVRARGRNPEGRAWQIAIERPLAEQRVVQRVVSLDAQAAATSGDYLVCYMREGRRISHTIDPRTLRPVEHGLACVTVICPRCACADAWATALMVLGPVDGYRLAEEKGLAVLFQVRQSEECFVESFTSAFGELL